MFRLEAAYGMGGFGDGTAVWEVFVDIRGTVKSQQLLSLQRIEHLKQGWKCLLVKRAIDSIITGENGICAINI